MTDRTFGRRGAALVAVVMTALITSVIAFGALLLAMSHARTSQVQMNRLRAQYAAEAGLVWAQQQLWKDPRWLSTKVVDLTEQAANFDMNGDGQLSATDGVDIILTQCGSSPCEPRRLQAKVTSQ